VKVFVDTSAFIALTDATDENHRKAREWYEQARTKGTRFVTTNFVVCETLNYLRMKVSYEAAVGFREGLRKSGLFDIVDISLRLDDEAFRIFKQYADKAFSFTDCTSFAAMQSLKLKNSFAFDRHFDQISGFQKLP